MDELLNAEIPDGDCSLPIPETTPPSVVDGRWTRGLEWPAVLWIGVLHLGALTALLCFTWKGVWPALVLSWITGSLGVCLGYHRLLTHGSFETFSWVRRFLAWCGMLVGKGPPIMWGANHRKHHCFSDQETDPHHPRHRRWYYSHMLWMLPRHARFVARWLYAVPQQKLSVVGGDADKRRGLAPPTCSPTQTSLVETGSDLVDDSLHANHRVGLERRRTLDAQHVVHLVVDDRELSPQLVKSARKERIVDARTSA